MIDDERLNRMDDESAYTAKMVTRAANSARDASTYALIAAILAALSLLKSCA